jgi:hypothetical protein
VHLDLLFNTPKPKRGMVGIPDRTGICDGKTELSNPLHIFLKEYNNTSRRICDYFARCKPGY